MKNPPSGPAALWPSEWPPAPEVAGAGAASGAPAVDVPPLPRPALPSGEPRRVESRAPSVDQGRGEDGALTVDLSAVADQRVRSAVARARRRRNQRIGATVLIVIYLVLCLAPLPLVHLGHTATTGSGQYPNNRPFLVEFSVALAYVGLAIWVLQFALVSRIRWLAAPYGIDVLHRFHRQMTWVSLAFILAHPALLLVQSTAKYLYLFNPITAPWRARFALISTALLLVLIAFSIWRRRLRIPYEIWKVSHGMLATAMVYLALAHMTGIPFTRVTGVANYSSGLGGRIIIGVVAVSLVLVLTWNRLVAPMHRRLHPWRVVKLVPERGHAVTVFMEPIGHPGFSFRPGQFAWLNVGESPFRVTQHPFSLSSPSGDVLGKQIAVTIKALGDWTHSMRSIRPGTRVYLDGPHGSFTLDLEHAMGYAFIAGGVGITPLYSMITTLCIREDPRPAVLFYANTDWESVTFRDELEELCLYMPNLKVVHVLSRPDRGWRGEKGRITATMLRRHLPGQFTSLEYFICGPEAMMDSAEQILLSMGVPEHRIHSERFNMV
jgi:predicted ferric reductase